MNEATLKRARWFWPWQDEKEETWLEDMSQQGWHLKSLHLPCVYIFRRGAPVQYAYRLDYMPAEKAKFQEYLQIFQDAGWEYLGEMSNWRYWRKITKAGETVEIFTDAESKIRKYKRLLAYLGFFLLILIMLGSNLFFNRLWADANDPSWISAIYLCGSITYLVIIPIFMVAVVQIFLRINQLKKKVL